MKMISDEDQNSDTDSDPPSPRSPQVEKRQYHNLLERNRRNVLKYSFWKLRSAIPSLAKKNLRMSEKKQASRAKILKRAIEYINRAELKRPARLRDIRDLQRENSYLEEQYQALHTAEETGNVSTMEAIFKGIDELKQKVYEEEASETEDDDEDTDDAANLPEENENVENEEEEEEEDQDGMNWDSDNEENIEPQQSWSNQVTETESSESDDSSEETSSEESE